VTSVQIAHGHAKVANSPAVFRPFGACDLLGGTEQAISL